MKYGLERLRDTLIVAESTRRSMRSNKSKDTSPELNLRQELWRRGARGYRLHLAQLPGKPDIVFPGKKLVVQVHGCFWHSCPICRPGRVPHTNAVYWEAKLRRNQLRDAEVASQLTALGFRVMIIWECAIERNVSGEAVRILCELARPVELS